MEKQQKIYTTGEVAEICRVSQQTIIRCFDSGNLGGFRVPGSRFRKIPLKNLIMFMRENQIPLDYLPKENSIEISKLETVIYNLESKSGSVNVLKEGPVLTIKGMSVYIKSTEGARDLLGKLDRCREQLLNEKYKLLPDLPANLNKAREYARDYINAERSDQEYLRLKDVLTLGVCFEDAFNLYNAQNPKRKDFWDKQVVEIQTEIKEVLRGLDVD